MEGKEKKGKEMKELSNQNCFSECIHEEVNSCYLGAT